MSSCIYFSCLFTKHKSQKRKIWRDGKLKVSPSGSISIYDIGSNIISGNDAAPVDTMCIHTSQVGTIKSGSELESEKFLITVEGEWRQQETVTTASSSNISGDNASLSVNQASVKVKHNGRDGMKKLLVHKFRKPTKFIPGQNRRNNHPPIIRKAPLQPGEYMQQFQGQGLRDNSYNHNNNNNNNLTRIPMNGGPQGVHSYNSGNAHTSHHVQHAQLHRYPQEEYTGDESHVPSHPSNDQSSGNSHGNTSSTNSVHYAFGTHPQPKQTMPSTKQTKSFDNAFVSNEFNPSSYYEESDEEEGDDDGTNNNDWNNNNENFQIEKNDSESFMSYHATSSKQDNCDEDHSDEDHHTDYDGNKKSVDSLSKSELMDLFAPQQDEIESQRQQDRTDQNMDTEDEPPNPFLQGLLQHDEAVSANVTHGITSNTIWSTDNDNNPWNADEVLDDDDCQNFEENGTDTHPDSSELKSTGNQHDAKDDENNEENEENITFSITMDESSSDDDSDDGSSTNE